MAGLVSVHSAESEKSNETAGQRRSSQSHRYDVLVSQMGDKEFRDSYVATHVRQFLAEQFRAFRGDLSQKEFGEKINQKQSAVSRLEDPNYGRETLQTLFEIASKLNVGVVVRFVDFKTFLNLTGDVSESAVRPAEYNQNEMNTFVQEQTLSEAYNNWVSRNWPNTAGAMPGLYQGVVGTGSLVGAGGVTTVASGAAQHLGFAGANTQNVVMLGSAEQGAQFFESTIPATPAGTNAGRNEVVSAGAEYTYTRNKLLRPRVVPAFQQQSAHQESVV